MTLPQRSERALREIADLTWNTQYDEASPAVVKFASRVHRIAADALRPEPVPAHCGCGPNIVQVECPYHGGAI